jgi:hypothetical protein
MKIACNGIGLVLFLGVAGALAGAQNQTPSTSSLGDYARQIRKDPGARATPKVFDNDNLPTQDKLSVIGQPQAPANENSSETKSDQPQSSSPAGAETKVAPQVKPGGEVKPGAEQKPPSATAKGADDDATKQTAEKQWADKIASQKDQIDLLARELDVLQREYQIRAAAMYADAGNRMRNSADWDKQDAQYKQQIADKQKALDDAKQKLEDLQEDARKAGAPASVREP